MLKNQIHQTFLVLILALAAPLLSSGPAIADENPTEVALKLCANLESWHHPHPVQRKIVCDQVVNGKSSFFAKDEMFQAAFCLLVQKVGTDRHGLIGPRGAPFVSYWGLLLNHSENSSYLARHPRWDGDETDLVFLHADAAKKHGTQPEVTESNCARKLKKGSGSCVLQDSIHVSNETASREFAMSYDAHANELKVSIAHNEYLFFPRILDTSFVLSCREVN